MKSAIFFLVMLLTVATALPNSAFAEPDIYKIPAVKTILGPDVKLFYLGKNAGMDGWVMFKDGGVQTLYLAPDERSIILGTLFAEEGANASLLQLAILLKNNPEFKATFEKAAGRKFDGKLLTSVPSDNNQISPGEKLFAAMAGANGVALGDSKAPTLHMVIDPRCPYCKATWKELRDDVAAKRLQVHLIPIGAEGSDNEREAARFLEIDAPLENWNKFIDGDKAVLAGAPDPTKLEAVRANHRTIDEWKINHTPYLVYRGKDGRVKIVQGQPDNIASVLADLQP